MDKSSRHPHETDLYHKQKPQGDHKGDHNRGRVQGSLGTRF